MCNSASLFLKNTNGEICFNMNTINSHDQRVTILCMLGVTNESHDTRKSHSMTNFVAHEFIFFLMILFIHYYDHI